MSRPNSTTTVEQDQTNPNEKLIDGLRQVAAFLTRHPELPPGDAMISLGNTFPFRDTLANDRDVLTRFAIAADSAGWSVAETSEYGAVKVKVELPGDVHLYAKVDLDVMGAVVPPTPAYARVLAECPHCGGNGGFGGPAGEGGEDCPTCDGRGYLVPDPPLDVRTEDLTGGLPAESDPSW